MKGIEYWILWLGALLLLAIITAPLAFLLFWATKFISTHEQWSGFLWLLLPVVWGYIFGLPWLARLIARQMAFEDRTLKEAAMFTLYDLRLQLSFLPLIGYWFEPTNGNRGKDSNEA